MAVSEVSVIAHLLDVEQNASLMVKNAQEEANKILSAERAKADAEFKSQFDKLVGELDASYKVRFDEISQSHDKQITEYKSSVEKTNQNKEKFNAFLKSVLAK